MPLSTDEEALLAAIMAAPADDAPRLIYADWLQERGEESKAEYLRTVVRLMHPPEDPVDVARVIVLANGLSEDWRVRVAARFEVLAQGPMGIKLFAYMMAALFKIALRSDVPFWLAEKPVALQNGMTREGAEELVTPWLGSSLNAVETGEQLIKLTIQPMTDESGPTLFAPRR